MELIRNEEMLYLGKRVSLEIDEIRYGILDSEWNLQNLRASFTRVYFPLDGEGILTFGDKRVTITPGNIYIVPSELNFSGFCPEHLNKIYIHLTLKRPDGSDLLAGIDHCIVLEGEDTRIAEVEELYRVADMRSVLRLKQLLYEMLMDAVDRLPSYSYPDAPHSPKVKAAISYIDEHLHAGLTIDEIVSALFVSKLGLQKSFKQELGKPIGKYIDDCLMARAEHELLDTSRSIKEISDQLGFCDQFYFSRIFRKKRALSPREYRARWNQ